MKEYLLVKPNKQGEQGLFAVKDFKKGDIVFKLEGSVSEQPTKYTIEVGEGEHLMDDTGQYLNHSCEPNTRIARKEREVRALRDIATGEELSFDYNSNETEMAAPFECHCGALNCQKLIVGKNRKSK